MFRILFLIFASWFSKTLIAQSYYLSPVKFPGQYIQSDQTKKIIFLKNKTAQSTWHLEYISEDEKDLRALIIHDQTDLALSYQNGSCSLASPNMDSNAQIWMVEETENEEHVTIQHVQSQKYLSYMGQGLIVSTERLSSAEWLFEEAKTDEQPVQNQNQNQNQNNLVVYTMSSCGRCAQTKEYLKKNAIPFQEYNTDKSENNNKMFEVLQKTGNYKGGSIQMPVIVYQGKVHYNIADLQGFLSKLKPSTPSNPNQNPTKDTPVVSKGNLTQAQKDAFVNRHNFYRKEVGVAPLVWNESLANHAYEWAKHLADNKCELKHRPDSGPYKDDYGENIAWSYNPDPVNSVDMWGAEKKQWKGGVVRDMSAGHYTQIIWSKTTEIGCAVVKCANGNYITVCNYNPAGNYIGVSPLQK